MARQYDDPDIMQSLVPDATPLPTKTPLHGQTWTWSVISQTVSILWLAPITTLLWLNYTDYVAGAGVGCMEFCNLDLDWPTQLDLDSRNHNILGALQLVAKFLEAWFAFVAGCLVYDLSMLLATRRDGLPLRHLFTHIEFTDLKNLFSLSAWTTMKPKLCTSKKVDEKRSSHTPLALYGFVALTSLLCLVVNLMGPATAVLSLPTLGMREISETNDVRYYDQVRTAGPPHSNVTWVLRQCSMSDFEAGSYGCAQTVIDQIVALKRDNSAISDVWQAGLLSFTPNNTGDVNFLSWIHSRQMLLDVEGDFLAFMYAKQNSTFQGYKYLYDRGMALMFHPEAKVASESQYRLYRESLLIVLQRNGPSLGSYSHCKRNMTIVRVSEDQEVHCYSTPTRQYVKGYASTSRPIMRGLTANRPSDNAGTMITKCVRVGSGWGAAVTNHTQFHVATVGNTSTPYEADVYSADRAIYLTPDDSECVRSDNSTEACDWARMFSADIPSDIRNTSLNVMITEYTAKGEKPILCETLAYLSFPTYRAEYSASSGSTGPVTLQGIERSLDTPPVSVHPDWVLAAWAVDSSGTIDAARAAATVLTAALQNTAADDSDAFGHAQLEFIQTNVISQALSLVDYTTTSSAGQGGPEPDAPSNLRPLREISQQVRVWSYGFGSRTSILGAAVAVAGCVVVALKTYIGVLAGRTRRLEPIALVVAALRQPEVGALRKISDRDAGRSRFLFTRDCDGNGGVRYSFLGDREELLEARPSGPYMDGQSRSVS